MGAPLGLKLLRLAETYDGDGLSVRLTDVGTPVQVGAELERTLCGLVEALLDAAHTARARSAEILLVGSPTSIVLSLRHDGRPHLEPAAGGRIDLLARRIDDLGGTLSVRARPGGGAQLTAELGRR